MTATPRLPNRPEALQDLTRWNRAGLTRFDYVDGDAAVWLEELRLALQGLYARGGEPDARTPEAWRDIFMRPEDETLGEAEMSALLARVVWGRLATSPQARPETRGRRSERLLAQYDAPPEEVSWEILRAFARATHVLLGHLDAYANEGFLRTATQWDNLRRLAAMVNYQPTPPASASATVSLDVKPEAGGVTVPRGLAMKYAPPEGGAPLIFETLEDLAAHPDLNAARVTGWNVNGRTLDIAPPGAVFEAPEKAALAPGDLAVLAAGSTGVAVAFAAVTRNEDAEHARIRFSDAPEWTASTHASRLMTEADAVRRGLPRTDRGSGRWFIAVEGLAGLEAGGVVLLNNVAYQIAEVLAQGIRVDTADDLGSSVTVTPLAPFEANLRGRVRVNRNVERMYFPETGGGVEMLEAPETITTSGRVRGIFENSDGSGSLIMLRYDPVTAAGRGYALMAGTETLAGKVIGAGPTVIPGRGSAPTRTIRFEGKPPKSLAEGAWFVARMERDDSLLALRVEGLRTGAGDYTILFDTAIDDPPEEIEFHGPMTRALPPLGWNRNPDPLPHGTVELTPVAGEARTLLKPGRDILLTHDDGRAVQGTVTLVRDVAPGVVCVDYLSPESVAGWAKGSAAAHLNTVRISHGETKGTKTLGSGDGERSGQAFTLQVGGISHIPSTVAESGVVPDIDVAVNGEVWPYADYIDPAAEGAKAFSTTLTEDGFLTIRFRRRLPTGQNNVAVTRHRVGVGAKGSGLPPGAFTKPMKKDRHVTAIRQPFPTAGGADREPVAAMRENAPARLSANGRAVSLSDFERLARRHASVWRARAEEVAAPGAVRVVRIVLVPKDGGPVTETLKADLRPVILDRALPGVRLVFDAFVPLHLRLGATVRVNLAAFDRTEVKRAAEDAVRRAFALEARDFGQGVYRSEILAALETVVGVENAVVTRFDLGAAYDLTEPRPVAFPHPWPRSVALRDDAVAAIFPAADQVAFLRPPGPGVPEDTLEIAVEDAGGPMT